MNSNKGLQKLFMLNKRFFSSALWNYSSGSNPHIYLTISKNGSNVGDLVFELYSN